MLESALEWKSKKDASDITKPAASDGSTYTLPEAAEGTGQFWNKVGSTPVRSSDTSIAFIASTNKASKVQYLLLASCLTCFTDVFLDHLLFSMQQDNNIFELTESTYNPSEEQVERALELAVVATAKSVVHRDEEETDVNCVDNKHLKPARSKTSKLSRMNVDEVVMSAPQHTAAPPHIPDKPNESLIPAAVVVSVKKPPTQRPVNAFSLFARDVRAVAKASVTGK
jgi:hypothetical protein